MFLTAKTDCKVTMLVCTYFMVFHILEERKNQNRVGLACQKVHKQGKTKVMVNIQSIIHPYIFAQTSKEVGM